jgi:hypothetical protein
MAPHPTNAPVAACGRTFDPALTSPRHRCPDCRCLASEHGSAYPTEHTARRDHPVNYAADLFVAALMSGGIPPVLGYQPVPQGATHGAGFLTVDDLLDDCLRATVDEMPGAVVPLAGVMVEVNRVLAELVHSAADANAFRTRCGLLAETSAVKVTRHGDAVTCARCLGGA